MLLVSNIWRFNRLARFKRKNVVLNSRNMDWVIRDCKKEENKMGGSNIEIIILEVR